MLYVFLIPAVVYVIIFNYIPMYGVQLAFKNYRAVDGIWGSPWAGLRHFERFVRSPNFFSTVGNTLGISLLSLAINFPAPIILALMLNYVRNARIKKTIQTVTYAPYFVSVVVAMGLAYLLLSPNSGVINSFRVSMGLDPIFYLGQASYFKPLYVIIELWRNVGWASIIYIAALAGVSQEQHEAAIVDGATKLHRIWHIDLPAISPTIVILFILRVGQIMNVQVENVFLLQNPLNVQSSEVISTYVYKVGILNAQYGFGAAVGLFNNVVNMVLLVIANIVARRLTESSLW